MKKTKKGNKAYLYRFVLITVMIMAMLLICHGCGKDQKDDNLVIPDNGTVNGNETDGASGNGLTGGEGVSDGNSRNQNQDGLTGSTDGTPVGNTDSESGLNAAGMDGTGLPEGTGRNTVIVLDPGHGGIFPGAEFDGRVEKKLTLQVAEMIKSYLEENYGNVTVYLTRESDIELSKDLVEELEMRAEFAKEKNADALVSIHFNATDGHNQHGATVYVSRRDNVHEAAQQLGECIEAKLTDLGLAREGVLTRKSSNLVDENGIAYDYYAINRHCANRDLIGIIVEHCFMDNSHDIAFMDSEEDLKALAKADAEGIAEYFGLPEIKG